MACWRHLRSGSAGNVVLVAALAIGQRSHGQRRAALRCILVLHERGEAAIGRDHGVVHGGCDFGSEPRLFLRREAGGILVRGQQKGIARDNTLALRGHLLEQEAHGHQVVVHTGAHQFFGLVQNAGNLTQAGDVVPVVLHGIERNGQWQVGQIGVNAVHLIHWHLVFLQLVVGVALRQHAQHELVRKLVLLAEAVSRDGAQPAGKGITHGMAVCDGRKRAVGEQRVVAVIAVGGGALRREP
jgi:hypothetical protein